MHQHSLLKIGQLSEQSGKSHRALRFYEERGLLQPRERTESGYRLYGEEALVQLRWIDRLQLLGFSLPEIQRFTEELRAQSTGVDLMQSLQLFYLAKKNEVEEKILKLRILEQELEQALLFLNVCGGCSSEMEPSACLTCQEHEVFQEQLVTHTGCMELMSKVVPAKEEQRAKQIGDKQAEAAIRSEVLSCEEQPQSFRDEGLHSFPELITAPLQTVT
jgi:DNA-binding transcriptional MerR regulator